MNIIGPDVSFYQDSPTTPQNIDFQKMKAAGAKFVILRAGQNTWADSDFKENYAAAKAAGLPRGVYWFYDSRSSPMSQAILCVSQIDGDMPEIGVWADLEENYGGQYKGWMNWRAFMKALDVKFPLVGVYTAPSYWMTNRPTDTIALDYFKSKPLWIANYNVLSPIVPSPWSFWLFWQYTATANGPQYGAESQELDMNYFNGDEQTFRNYFDLGEVPQPETGETMSYFKVTPTVLNIRSSPAFIADPSNDIGDLLKDDIVDADALPVGGFRRLRAVWRNNVPVALPASPTGECWASSSYLTATVFTPPVVTALPDVLFIGVTRDDVKEYRKAA
jgi:lysozyme